MVNVSMKKIVYRGVAGSDGLFYLYIYTYTMSFLKQRVSRVELNQGDPICSLIG